MSHTVAASHYRQFGAYFTPDGSWCYCRSPSNNVMMHRRTDFHFIPPFGDKRMLVYRSRQYFHFRDCALLICASERSAITLLRLFYSVPRRDRVDTPASSHVAYLLTTAYWTQLCTLSQASIGPKELT